MKIVIFASGSGSTFSYLANNIRGFEILGLFCDRKNAGVLERAREKGVAIYRVDDEGSWKDQLLELDPDYILLAGYLKILPADIVDSFKDRILNVHPSLLPKYGGRDFYGDRVHRAVLENKEKETGSTIHLVDKGIDTGRILAQVRVPVYQDDTVESLAERVQKAEKPLYLETFLTYGGRK